ncbi:MAG: glycoside hydrolase family 88 protein [Verrucomicrobiota bacterium]|nr:glycoside hydrolase family 88 protein [Verrucomicrobiota bacterium]
MKKCIPTVTPVERGGYDATGAAPYTVRQKILCDRSNIKNLMKQVFDFQTKAFQGEISAGWKVGTFYTGVYAAYEATGDSLFYDGAKAWCESAKWKSRAVLGGNFHADCVCVAQTYLDIYMKEKNPLMIADIQANLEGYFGKETLFYKEMGYAGWKDAERPFIGRNLWWWSDALYMAPAVFARMHAATGESRYLDLLHRLYWDSVDFLYCEEEGLFMRDESFFDKKTPEGRPVFWGRGNGWVYAGLMRMLPYIPDHDPQKEKYIRLFQELTRVIVSYQQSDGLWRSSLNEPSWRPNPETSASSFFCYGLLAGINSGYLDAKTWLPSALRAWEGLLNCINTDGRLGFAQLVAAAPGITRAEDSIDYTHGAFLLAASELYKMGLVEKGFSAVSPPYEIQTLVRNGIWSDHHDDRMVVDENFIHCGMTGRDGNPQVDLYSLREVWSPHVCQQYALSVAEGSAPALLKLQDGRLLAAYAKSGEHNQWFFKTAEYVATDFNVSWTLKWSPEQRVECPVEQPLCNLLQLAEENGRVFNLYAAGGSLFSQYSDDLSKWTEPVRLFEAEGDLSFKWVSNGMNRIDILCAEQVGDVLRVFHIAYAAGQFQPLEPVYEGNPSSDGWFADLEHAASGAPVAVFTAAGADGNTVLFSAKQNPRKEWEVDEITSLCKCAGVGMDPDDTSSLYVSSDTDPATGRPVQSGRFQIFRGKGGAEGWRWEQLTFDVSEDHFNPSVPRSDGERNCVVWMRGQRAVDGRSDGQVVGILER